MDEARVLQRVRGGGWGLLDAVVEMFGALLAVVAEGRDEGVGVGGVQGKALADGRWGRGRGQGGGAGGVGEGREGGVGGRC